MAEIPFLEIIGLIAISLHYEINGSLLDLNYLEF